MTFQKLKNLVEDEATAVFTRVNRAYGRWNRAGNSGKIFTTDWSSGVSEEDDIDDGADTTASLDRQSRMERVTFREIETLDGRTFPTTLRARYQVRDLYRPADNKRGFRLTVRVRLVVNGSVKRVYERERDGGDFAGNDTGWIRRS